jgi:hypothetical protein
MFDTSEMYAVEMDDYATSPALAAEKMTLNQLKRFFPTVKNFPDGKLAQYTLSRVTSHLMHVDEKFDMNSTFDSAFYDTMLTQAKLYAAWLDSDSDVIPAELVYKRDYIQPAESDEDETPAPVIRSAPAVNVDTVPKKVYKPRAPSTTSGYQRAAAMYAEDVASGKDRQSTLARFESELGIAKATGNVYYSKFKHATSV